MYYPYQTIRLGVPALALLGMFVLPEHLNQVSLWIFVATGLLSVFAGLVPWRPRLGAPKRTASERSQPNRIGIAAVTIAVVAILTVGGFMLGLVLPAAVVGSVLIYSVALWCVATAPVPPSARREG